MSFALNFPGYLAYYAMESGWRDLITSWMSSTMNEHYTTYLNETNSAAAGLLEKLNSLDELHMTLGCCGSSGYQDWQNVTKNIPLDELRYLAYPPAKNTTTSVVPYSCCKWMEQSLVDICDHTSGDTNSIHTEGCTERLVHLIVYEWLRVPQVLLYMGAFQPLAFGEQLRSIGKTARAQKELAMRVIHRKKKNDV
ncbi:CD63 antigen, partial [Taenia solium]